MVLQWNDVMCRAAEQVALPSWQFQGYGVPRAGQVSCLVSFLLLVFCNQLSLFCILVSAVSYPQVTNNGHTFQFDLEGRVPQVTVELCSTT